MSLTRLTDEAKNRARKRRLWGLIGAAVLLVILRAIGYPSDLWTPASAGDFFRGFLAIGLIGCGVLMLSGPMTSLENRDVREREAGLHPIGSMINPAMINPPTGAIGVLAVFGIIVDAVLAIRYIYLLFGGTP